MNLNRFFDFQTKTVTFAAALVGISVLVSRILGLIRDRLLAGRFGAGIELDIYFAAFRIPDLIYGILITGGIMAAFIPIFSDYYSSDKKRAWKLTINVLNCFFLLLVGICGMLALFTPHLIKFIVPGFGAAQKELAIKLTRVMFLSPIIFGVSSIFSGILHYFNRFLVYSVAPILYNLGIILGILFLAPRFGLIGLAYGVILGALFHLLIQVPSVLNVGFFWKPQFNFFHLGIKRIFRLMAPRTVGSAAYHLNLIVMTAIASTLISGSIAVFNFSNNLYYVPIGLVGISFALASFPALSKSLAQKKIKKFLEDFSSTFRQIIFLVVPLSALMFVLRAQIVRLILGTGKFGWRGTRLTAACLGLFCFGIFAASLIPFLARAFFSFKDTKTPVIVALGAMSLNVVLAFSLVEVLGGLNFFSWQITSGLNLWGIKDIRVVGLPLALSISAILQFSFLFYFLHRKIQGFSFEIKNLWKEKLKDISISWIKILICSGGLIISSFGMLRVVANWVNMESFLGILIQGGSAGVVGILVYIIGAFVLRSPELKIIKSAFIEQFRPK